MRAAKILSYFSYIIHFVYTLLEFGVYSFSGLFGRVLGNITAGYVDTEQLAPWRKQIM